MASPIYVGNIDAGNIASGSIALESIDVESRISGSTASENRILGSIDVENKSGAESNQKENIDVSQMILLPQPTPQFQDIPIHL